jgi:hypothetical protein
MGHEESQALQVLGLGAASFECWEGWRIETRPSAGLNPLKKGPSGAVVRTGGLLAGPVPLALRLFSIMGGKKRSKSLRRLAAMSAIAGSLLTRIGWIYAGHASAKDWRAPLEIPYPPEPSPKA